MKKRQVTDEMFEEASAVLKNTGSLTHALEAAINHAFKPHEHVWRATEITELVPETTRYACTCGAHKTVTIEEPKDR